MGDINCEHWRHSESNTNCYSSSSAGRAGDSFIAIRILNEYIFSQKNIKRNCVLTNKDKILLQNARFYEAFENSDLNVLDVVWSHSSNVKCIHPGWHLLEGWDAVRESWQNIFHSDNTMKVSLRNVSAEVYGKLGIVTLVEEITYKTLTSIRTGAIMATNIFEFDGEEWKMIHHHGSPMIVAEEEESDDKYRYN